MSLNSSPHPAVQAMPLSPVPGGARERNVQLSCFPASSTGISYSAANCMLGANTTKCFFMWAVGGETTDLFWSEPPADVHDTFFTPLYTTCQALVIIYCHRNHFLHAANCKSFRTAGRHCPGKGKDNTQGKVSGSKQNSVLQQQLPGERQG